MTTTQTQYVKVTRKDGEVFYFERSWGKHADCFAPVGGGFLITGFDQTSKVEDIDRLPKDYQIGACDIDDSPSWKCICNPIDRWNGWAKPFIFASDIGLFIEDVNTAGDPPQAYLKGDSLIIDQRVYQDDAEIETIEKTTVLGIECYYLGNLGWCFDFQPKKVN